MSICLSWDSQLKLKWKIGWTNYLKSRDKYVFPKKYVLFYWMWSFVTKKKNHNKRPSFKISEANRLFFSLAMTFNPDQEYLEFKYAHINYRDFVLIPLYSNGIYPIIGGQMINIYHDLFICSAYLDHWRKPDIDPLKKDRGGVFLECCTFDFHTKILLVFHWSTIQNGKKALKYHVYGGNNFHGSEKQGIFMPAYVLR